MFKGSTEIAVSIPLKVWKYPQGNPVLIYSERKCEIFFGCWNEDRTPAEHICRIGFNSAWASRSCRVEFLPYKVEEPKRSAILYIENSAWLEESSEYRLKCYPEWKTWDKKTYHHFVVEGHDEFIEILAESYKEEIILLEEAEKFLPSAYLEFFN